MAMRDALLGRLHAAMAADPRVFIVSDDFGAPTLDRIRTDFPKRFVNVGIAEQNAINVATGLALEGFASFAYGIAGFMTMRCYEQVRTNLSMAAQLRPLNANVVGVGAGLSYDLSGPSHHCLEDLTLMRLLPNLEVFSPSDWALAAEIASHALRSPRPKYIRLDSKPLPRIYPEEKLPRLESGFHELAVGRDACLVATGYMTHVALRAAARAPEPLGVVDLFAFRPLDEGALLRTLGRYRRIVTVEEAFIRRGGLDALVVGLLSLADSTTRVRSLGVDDRYLFEVGNRAHLHRLCGIDEEGILRAVSQFK
jgi:transketolase